MRDISKLEMNDLVSDDTIKELFQDTESEAQLSIKLTPYIARARELKALGQFMTFINSCKAEKRKLAKSQAPTMHQEKPPIVFETDDESYSFRVGGYELIDGAIYKEVIGTFNNLVKICSRPMFPVKILTNIKDNSVKVKLCYQDDFMRWQNKTFGQEVISNSRSIGQLSQYGFDITSENAKDVVKLLTELKNNNLEVISRGYSASSFGWQRFNGNSIFLPYDKEIEFDGYERFFTLSNSLESKGEYDKWFLQVADMRASGRKEPLVYLVAAFASVLLKPLNMLPFIVNLWTATGRGKTVALMMACSVWANPEEGAYLTDPTSTRVALEQRLGVLNSLPMMIDDLSKMKDGKDEDFTSLIYFLCAGKGKERSNVNLGMEVVTTWKNVIMTNMERPLATETMKGGAINRILDFESEPGSYFTNPKGQDIGNKVVECVKNNYGFAGRQFVEIVKNIPAEELKKRFNDKKILINQKAAEQNCKKEEKQVAPMALMLLTAELIESEIFQDGVLLDVDWCINQLKDVDEVSEDQRAYNILMEEVGAGRFKNFGQHGIRDVDLQYKVLDRWGFIDIGNDLVCLYSFAYAQIAQKRNFSTISLAKWAKANNLLVHDKDKLTKKRLDTNSSQYFNMYCFKMKSNGEINLTDEDLDEK